MKTNSRLILILTLFVMMLAAGITSALISYLMGQQALKVVTQPEMTKNNRLKNKSFSRAYKGLQLADEKKILVEVYNLIHADEKKDVPDQSKLQQSNRLVSNTVIDEDENSDAPSFPIINRSKGVTLELVKTQTEGSSLLLDLNLKNEGTEAVRFLYSFIDVKDDRGKVISAIPEGLPDEIPANGQSFSGRVKIPLALLDQSNNISLTLTDYPDQNIELELKQIPVQR